MRKISAFACILVSAYAETANIVRNQRIEPGPLKAMLTALVDDKPIPDVGIELYQKVSEFVLAAGDEKEDGAKLVDLIVNDLHPLEGILFNMAVNARIKALGL